MCVGGGGGGCIHVREIILSYFILMLYTVIFTDCFVSCIKGKCIFQCINRSFPFSFQVRIVFFLAIHGTLNIVVSTIITRKPLILHCIIIHQTPSKISVINRYISKQYTPVGNILNAGSSTYLRLSSIL